jgi:hypothetical protein
MDWVNAERSDSREKYHGRVKVKLKVGMILNPKSDTCRIRTYAGEPQKISNLSP